MSHETTAAGAPMEAVLVAPDRRWRESVVEAFAEGFRRGTRPPLRPGEVRALARDFDGFLAERLRPSTDIVLPNGRRAAAVPSSLHWLVAGETFLGELSLRHTMNDYLRQSGGHIGYGIRPGVQGRGFGKRLLALGLIEARRRGIADVLITCHDDNPASAGVIEANGGVLENVVDDIFGGGPLRRYWVRA